MQPEADEVEGEAGGGGGGEGDGVAGGGVTEVAEGEGCADASFDVGRRGCDFVDEADDAAAVGGVDFGCRVVGDDAGECGQAAGVAPEVVVGADDGGVAVRVRGVRAAGLSRRGHWRRCPRRLSRPTRR